MSASPAATRSPLSALSAPLAQALSDEAARHDGALVVAAQSAPLPDLLDAFAATNCDAFYWEQPAQDFGLLALGTATAIEVSGPGRLAEAARWWRETVDDAVDAAVVVPGASIPDRPVAPFAAGGFAFADAAPPSDSVWQDWPRGAWVAPSVVLERRALATSVQLQVVTPGDVPATTALAEVALRARPGGPSPDGPAPDGARLQLHDDPGHGWWDDSVRDVLRAIAAGRLRKQVLARRICAGAASPIDVTRVLRALRDRFPSATIFALRRGGATFLGASPEELVGLRGDRIAAAALAGTSRGAGDGSRLLTDRKERREHEFVVEALRERLSPICRRLHVPETPELMTLPDLSHLLTPVCGTLAEPRGLLDLIDTLHPTPAVGATPREADRAAELEPFDRGWYAGPVGWSRGDRGGEGDAVVALRSALVWGRRAALYAGCGIVQGSDPELEWREARLKMVAVRDALGVAIGGDAPPAR